RLCEGHLMIAAAKRSALSLASDDRRSTSASSSFSTEGAPSSRSLSSETRSNARHFGRQIAPRAAALSTSSRVPFRRAQPRSALRALLAVWWRWYHLWWRVLG